MTVTRLINHLHAIVCLYFFNDTATTEIYTLSLHDALPISRRPSVVTRPNHIHSPRHLYRSRSEEHTSELQSLAYLVCRLLLENRIQVEEGRPAYRSHSGTCEKHILAGDT